MRILTTVTILLIANISFADICKWRDESGKVQFSDKAPEGVKAECAPVAEESTGSHIYPAKPFGNTSSCELETRSCATTSEIGCVSFGVPAATSTCDSFCQEVVIKKLTLAGVSVYTNPKVKSPSSPQGCVGYRADMGGTEEGARCIANVLGYEYMNEGCNSDGWPYNVRVK